MSRVILLLVLVSMLIFWFFTIKRLRSNHFQNSQSIREPLDITPSVKGPTGPMGLPGNPGIMGPTGPTGHVPDLQSLPSSWIPTRYVTIQHIPNSKNPVSLADIQIFDNQNVRIQPRGV
jgi:hypothetical protein